MKDLESQQAGAGGIAPEAGAWLLARWTGSLLSRVAGRMRAQFDARVTPLGIRGKHYGIIALLRDGPLTQVEIGRILWIDRTTMVALIDELEKLGLVGRERHPADRRAHAVTLTEQGRQVLCAATKAADATEEECFASLSDGERKQLHGLLLKVLQAPDATFTMKDE